MQETLPARVVVLLGVGHTNAHIVRAWRMERPPDTALVCVSNFSWATYSGMLPGTLAGHYRPEEMQIDLRRLCASAGARLLCEAPTGLDVARQELYFEDRPPLRYDVLSVGLGSVPQGAPGLAEHADFALTIKPMQTFVARLSEWFNAWSECASRPSEIGAAGRRGPRVAVVGGGAAGVEIACCLFPWFAARGAQPRLTLYDAHEEILRGYPAGALVRARRELSRLGVRVCVGAPVAQVGHGFLEIAGAQEPFDLVLWAAGAEAPPVLKRFGLPRDAEGFVRTDDALRVEVPGTVFAVGDCAAIEGTPLPRAGVYAVRQGPVLWENVRRALDARPMTSYRPQRQFLSLLNLGDGRALLSYRGWSSTGRWCMRLKDRIDRRFMRMYQTYPPPMMNSTFPAQREANAAADRAPAEPRCAGCGGKVAADVLQRVLRRLNVAKSPRVVVGLADADDAAVVRAAAGSSIAFSMDFFRAFVDDPFLVGRVAAVHAVNDLYAIGATPVAALAQVTLPFGTPEAHEALLHEVLAGAVRELSACGAVLAGGHTSEGADLAVGFTVMGDVANGAPPGCTPKQGDALVLTKPLGSGVLLAAQMRARCEAPWYDTLERSLLQGQQRAAALAHDEGAQIMTDVTGFGLAGHLLAKLRASELCAELWLARLPALLGAESLLSEGLESSLAEANRRAASEVACDSGIANTARYQLLFDPQTSGGLLLAVGSQKVSRLIGALAAAGYTAAEVGRIVDASQLAQRAPGVKVWVGSEPVG